MTDQMITDMTTNAMNNGAGPTVDSVAPVPTNKPVPILLMSAVVP